jgi:polyhydroxyalkanoate synthesis regulator phasin
MKQTFRLAAVLASAVLAVACGKTDTSALEARVTQLETKVEAIAKAPRIDREDEIRRELAATHARIGNVTDRLVGLESARDVAMLHADLLRLERRAAELEAELAATKAAK